MKQEISLVTLGVADLARSKRFYADGFGWTPIADDGDIIFYQMGGLMLGIWLKTDLVEDMQANADGVIAAFALAHLVESRDQVEALLDRLVAAGGTLLREAGEAPHGGVRGYVSDPDNHSWEIAWNARWTAIEHERASDTTDA